MEVLLINRGQEQRSVTVPLGAGIEALGSGLSFRTAGGQALVAGQTLAQQGVAPGDTVYTAPPAPPAPPTFRSLGLGCALGAVGPNIGAANDRPTHQAPAGTPTHMLVKPGLDVVVDVMGAAQHFHCGTANLLEVLAKLTHPVSGEKVATPQALRFYRCNYAITGQQSELKDAKVEDVSWTGTVTGSTCKEFDLTDKKPVRWLWCTVETTPA